jgi:hypothetical protein
MSMSKIKTEMAISMRVNACRFFRIQNSNSCGSIHNMRPSLVPAPLRCRARTRS